MSVLVRGLLFLELSVKPVALLLGGLFLIVSSLGGISVAKECKCEKHEAKATGSGSCSLTEDTSYCDITFTGGSSSSSQSAPVITSLQKRFTLSIKPESALAQLNQREANGFSSDDIKQIIVAALMNTVPLDVAQPTSAQIELVVSNIFDDKSIAESFRSTGCINLRNGDFRFFLISAFSKVDSCNGK
jgi:hypothetical protein